MNNLPTTLDSANRSADSAESFCKHTPGPWEVSKEWDGTSIKAGPFHVTHTIQSCGFHSDEEDKVVTQANARLIAAAPELLEALQSAVQWGAPFKDAPSDARPDWFSLANTAIKKATVITC